MKLTGSVRVKLISVKTKAFFLFLYFVGLFVALDRAFSIEVPRYQGPVLDQAQFLSFEEKKSLIESLVHFQRTYGPSLQVFTLPSLEGENIEDYSIRVVEAWKIGDQKKDDGVLLLVSLKEKRIRIEVGQGLEGKLPDVLAGRIIREKIAPFFKRSLYKEGLASGLQAIAKTLGGDLHLSALSLKGNWKTKKGWKSKGDLFSSILFLLLLFLFIISGFLGNRGSGHSLLLAILLGSMMGSGYRGRGRSGWSRGGFGGGFGGFGGGFSGGGASGGW